MRGSSGMDICCRHLNAQNYGNFVYLFYMVLFLLINVSSMGKASRGRLSPEGVLLELELGYTAEVIMIFMKILIADIFNMMAQSISCYCFRNENNILFIQ